jgi:hypothetical protein
MSVIERGVGAFYHPRMLRHIKLLSFVVLGFVAGVAFVISCGKGASPAGAQIKCDAYEVSRLYIESSSVVVTVPAGWTPIGGAGEVYAILARCKP